MTENLPPGLQLIENFITKAEERQLLKHIYEKIPDAKPPINHWKTELKRRVQQYGYAYDYTKRDVGDPIEAIPDWADFLMDRMLEQELILAPMEQLIINEYTPGQGISKHWDSPIFGNTVISISLGSPCSMIFRPRNDPSNKVEINLKPRSILIMTGPARWDWTHEIPARKSDHNIPRSTRVSLTYRYLHQNDPRNNSS